MTDKVEHDIAIADRPEERAYVIEVNGIRAGKAEYRGRDDLRIFTHTEIADAYAGMGLATRLVEFALEDMRSRGGSVVPLCPFFAAYIKKNPDFDDIVDHEMTMSLKRRHTSD